MEREEGHPIWMQYLTARRGFVLTGTAVAIGLVAAVSFGLVGVLTRSRPVDRGSVPIHAAPTTTHPSAPAKSAALPAAGSLPTSLSIAQLHVQAPIVPVAVTAGGALTVPDDVHTLGWWAGSALPGSSSGSVVIDGHVDSAAAGAGALFELRQLSVGSVVTVVGTPQTVRYQITGLREYDKADLPAASLFTQAGPPRLVLITCGGPFDAATRHYRDNIVAFGVPVSF